MSHPGKAVFLSYASQDAAAAKRICDALRTAGIEVWFDAEGGLEHGDEWDAKIRRQIKECVLFIAVISAYTQAREEGYFRIEWELAAQRALGIASGVAFLLPVVIDDTREPEALVPDRFRAVQWTRLAGGQVSPEVLARLLKLWSHRVGAVQQSARETWEPGRPRPGERDEGAASPSSRSSRRRFVAGVVVVGVIAIALAAWQFRTRGAQSPSPAAATAVPVPKTEVEKLLTRVWGLYEKQDDATQADWALAEDLAERATKLEETNADAWAAYSQATLGAWVFGYNRTAARFADARTRAERAVGLDPQSFEARFAIANCHRRQAATRVAAEKALRDLVAERPTDRRVIRMLAQTLRDLGRTDEAIGWLDRAAAMPGGDPIAIWGKYAVYSAAGRTAEAEATIDQTLAIHRSPSALLRKVVLSLLVRGDLPEAAAVLSEVPGPFLLKGEGIYASYLLGRWRRDPAACLAALQLATGDVIDGSNYLPSPNSAVPTDLWRGDAYALAQNRAAAEKHWRDALVAIERRRSEQPGENGWIFWHASLLARLGPADEGLRVLRLYQQLSGTSTRLGERLAVNSMLVLLGQHEEAYAGWERLRAGVPEARERNLLRNELRFDPAYDALREQPRFQALLAALTAPHP